MTLNPDLCINICKFLHCLFEIRLFRGHIWTWTNGPGYKCNTHFGHDRFYVWTIHVEIYGIHVTSWLHVLPNWIESARSNLENLIYWICDCFKTCFVRYSRSNLRHVDAQHQAKDEHIVASRYHTWPWTHPQTERAVLFNRQARTL